MKLKLIILILFVNTLSWAQIPTNHVAKYDFTNSSLTNLANPGTGDVRPTAPNTAVFVNDRQSYSNSALNCNNVKHSAFAMKTSGGAQVNEIALSFWINMQNEPATATQDEHIIDYVNTNGNGISFGIEARGNFYASTNVGGISKRRVFSNSSLSTAGWNHVFIQFRRSYINYTADVFINGVRNNTLSDAISINRAGGSVLFSENTNENARLIINKSSNFSGSIDDIRLYHATLGTSDVQRLSNEQKCATNVNIRSFKLKNALLAHGATQPVNGVQPITGTNISVIDTNGDGEICTTEAQAYSGTIDLSNVIIGNLTAGIEAFTNATTLYLNNCSLTTLDVSNNTSLKTLYVNDNQLINLDISANTALTVLNAINNQLTSLNLANGNNSAMTIMRASGNPNLSCIQHDTGFTPTYGWVKDVATSWSTNCSAVYSLTTSATNGAVSASPLPTNGSYARGTVVTLTATPNSGYTFANWSGDATGTTSSTTVTMNSNKSVTANFTQICTNFVNIPDINFKNALLAHGATRIINGLSAITGTGIGIIDTNGDGKICVSEAQAYTGTINISYTMTRALTITDLTGLEAFTNITGLDCSQKGITGLNVSNNTKLRTLYASKNKFTTLNLLNNTALNTLYVNDNKISSLDLSKNTNLKTLYAFNNQFTSLNLANGNNSAMTIMRASGNPNLSCIQHDTGFTPTTGWVKDVTTSWSTNCGTAGVNNQVFNSTVKIYPNPATKVLNISSEIIDIKSVEIYNILGRKIIDTNTQNIDIRGLTNGMYIAKIKSNDNKLAIKKFIKQ